MCRVKSSERAGEDEIAERRESERRVRKAASSTRRAGRRGGNERERERDTGFAWRSCHSLLRIQLKHFVEEEVVYKSVCEWVWLAGTIGPFGIDNEIKLIDERTQRVDRGGGKRPTCPLSPATLHRAPRTMFCSVVYLGQRQNIFVLTSNERNLATNNRGAWAHKKSDIKG